jgi:ribosomal protein S18 acetylase RimI-like enzyme
MRTFTIQSVSPSEFDGFIAYLNEHLAENGTAEAGYFQPLSRSTSTFPIDRVAAFRSGLEIPVGQQGWRRAWAALGQDREIVGHIDLRGHSERYSEHRCLLGMGVHRACRRQGIGSSLIQDARLWAAATNLLEHIDLQVLSSNRAALDLYRKAGFVQVGEIREMFKIDGQYFGYTTMTVPSRGEKNAV